VQTVLSGLATRVGRDISWWLQPVSACGALETPA
jgi:hypothetical protein